MASGWSPVGLKSDVSWNCIKYFVNNQDLIWFIIPLPGCLTFCYSFNYHGVWGNSLIFAHDAYGCDLIFYYRPFACIIVLYHGAWGCGFVSWMLLISNSVFSSMCTI